MLLVSLCAANLIGGYCANRWNGHDEIDRLKFMWFMGGTVFALLIVYGCTMTTVQGIFLCGIYLFASYSDIKSRLVDDSVHCLVLAVALIGREIYEVPFMAISAGLICGIMLIVAVVSKGGGVGGADIKLAAASAFLLGFQRAAIGLCIGLIVGVIVNLIKNKKTGKAEGFPLVPYIAAGFMLAFFVK